MKRLGIRIPKKGKIIIFHSWAVTPHSCWRPLVETAGSLTYECVFVTVSRMYMNSPVLILPPGNGSVDDDPLHDSAQRHSEGKSRIWLRVHLAGCCRRTVSGGERPPLIYPGSGGRTRMARSLRWRMRSSPDLSPRPRDGQARFEIRMTSRIRYLRIMILIQIYVGNDNLLVLFN